MLSEPVKKLKLFRTMTNSAGTHRIQPLKTKPLFIDNNGRFREIDTGRVFHMNGINFASNTKLPKQPVQKTHFRPDDCGFYDDADQISFVGKPFPLNHAYEHISRIKQCGYNTIRFVTTWESIEHEGPRIYDVDYADYLVEMLKVIDEIGGLYVFIDPHQDVWSRFSGGSGAPIWTLYAAGLEPRNFESTMAAKVHHMAADPAEFTKMVWATNYNRLASEVMFTLFFSGKIYTPKAVINGINIQDFLQDHFINAFSYLMNHIKIKIPNIFNSCLLGIESLNEPNSGLYGFEDIAGFPSEQKLKLDETPTPIQAFRLGMGYPEKVDIYSLSIFGPTKCGTDWIDPRGTKAWVTPENNKDKHYGFNRSPDWKLGECIFAQHGVWDSSSGELILHDYFRIHPSTGEILNEKKFINGPFLDFWYKFRESMRKIDQNMFLIMQPPVLQIPPQIENNSNYVDDKTIVALHYYDGMSLMFQKWNRIINVDTLGIMRGRYFNPIFGLIFGEKSIRRSIKRQLKGMAKESHENVGYNIPIIFTETGMPFNMDDKKSYKNGEYYSQESANDAILSGLENEQFNFTYWCYNPDNCHQWGDCWNLEDFSIWSKDDVTNLNLKSGTDYNDWLDKNSVMIRYNHESPDAPQTGNSNESDTDSNEISVSSGLTGRTNSLSSINKKLLKETSHSYIDLGNEDDFYIDLTDGIRAMNAILRPVPYLVNGYVKHCEFDVLSKSFHLTVHSEIPKLEVFPDIIVIPKHHYKKNKFQVRTSSGSYKIKNNSLMQWIEWDHSEISNKNVTLHIHLLDSLGEEIYSSGPCSNLKELACGY
jgi:hypothetical protein